MTSLAAGTRLSGHPFSGIHGLIHKGKGVKRAPGGYGVTKKKKHILKQPLSFLFKVHKYTLIETVFKFLKNNLY